MAFNFFENAAALRLLPNLISLKISLGSKAVFGKSVRIYERVAFQAVADGCLNLGDRVSLQQGVRLQAEKGAKIVLGRDVYLGEYCELKAVSLIAIGAGTLVGPHCSFLKDVRVGKDVWIGAGTKIAAGVIIGDGCVIGAGSEITENIPPYSVAAGAPARILKKRGMVSLKMS